MAQKLYEESNIEAIASAIRVYTGDTRVLYDPNNEPVVKVSKTANANSFTDYDSAGYGNKQDVFDVVTIKGAAKLKVTMAYQTENATYDYVQVMEGETATASGTKYGGSTKTTTELDINGDAVTFYFHSDSSICTYMGYYAEIRGYDANGNPLSETPNTYKVADMAIGIADIRNALDKELASIFDGTVKEFNIPDGTTKLSAYCLYGRGSLHTVTIPETVTYIGDRVFYNCTNLNSINLPSGLTYLGGYVFYNCNKLSITEIPLGVSLIDIYAFYDNAMPSFTIHQNVTTIKAKAFAYCDNLATVTFKGTPSSIAEDVFLSCSNLATINVPWSEGAVANAPWGATNATINYNYTS